MKKLLKLVVLGLAFSFAHTMMGMSPKKSGTPPNTPTGEKSPRDGSPRTEESKKLTAAEVLAALFKPKSPRDDRKSPRTLSIEAPKEKWTHTGVAEVSQHDYRKNP